MEDKFSSLAALHPLLACHAATSERSIVIDWLAIEKQSWFRDTHRDKLRQWLLIGASHSSIHVGARFDSRIALTCCDRHQPAGRMSEGTDLRPVDARDDRSQGGRARGCGKPVQHEGDVA